MGVPPNTPLNGDQLLEAMNERLAAANYIYMNDINKAENNKSK